MERPRLKATLVVPPVRAGDQLGLLLGLKGFDIRLSKGDLSLFADLVGHLSGAYTREEIACRTGISADSVTDVVERLHAFGLVYDYRSPPATGEIPRQQFLKVFEDLVTVLRFDMFRHPIFAEMLGNETLFLATATEYFHLIRDAEWHIGMAREHAPDALKQIIGDYRDEERDHYRSLEPGLLEAFGGSFDAGSLVPLAATESLLLKTRELARSDTLAYLACCSFSEARMLSGTAGVPDHWTSPVRGVFEAFLDHAREDSDGSHSSLLSNALEHNDATLFPADAGRILSTVHEYKHYFDNLNGEILRVYSQPGAPLPRLRQRWEDFLIAPRAMAVTTNEH